MNQNSNLTPKLSAIMCDGMGWFSKNDYKRMLLLYDEIHYLLPQTLVEFRDVTGRQQYMGFPLALQNDPTFKIHHYEPDQNTLDMILLAARQDVGNTNFDVTVKSIPEFERIYAWRVINADGHLGAGKSISLAPDEVSLAHAILLNKFLMAADQLDCIPITGKPYIHALISEKYRQGVEIIKKVQPDLLPIPLQSKQISFNPIARQIMSSIVPDAELDSRTDAEILKYKEENKELFEQFSYTVRQLVSKVHSLPLSKDFEREVKELANTEVWREQKEIERELRSAWEGFFKGAVKAVISGAVSGAITAGIAPLLSLGSISIASSLVAASTVAPWATSELISFLEKRKKAQQHGLYYLTRFVS
jgi:hypothetical protein